jgi:hypothetical protein
MEAIRQDFALIRETLLEARRAGGLVRAEEQLGLF